MSKNGSQLGALGRLIAQLVEDEASRLLAHPEPLREQIALAVRDAMSQALVRTVTSMVEETTEATLRKSVRAYKS